MGGGDGFGVVTYPDIVDFRSATSAVRDVAALAETRLADTRRRPVRARHRSDRDRQLLRRAWRARARRPDAPRRRRCADWRSSGDGAHGRDRTATLWLRARCRRQADTSQRAAVYRRRGDAAGIWRRRPAPNRRHLGANFDGRTSGLVCTTRTIERRGGSLASPGWPPASIVRRRKPCSLASPTRLPSRIRTRTRRPASPCTSSAVRTLTTAASSARSRCCRRSRWSSCSSPARTSPVS